jgi:hypothetical protein
MAWTPNPKGAIGLNEPIGRRFYDEPMLAGAADQSAFLGIDLRHFEETRDRQISLDRCGNTSVEPGVLSYLFPRARAMGDAFTPPKAFSGWLYVRARELEQSRIGWNR